MTTIKILNLSSGTILSIEESSIEKLNLKIDLAWDSVDVMGRMSGIKNYKNTTRTRNIEVKVPKASNAKLFYFEQVNDIPTTVEGMKKGILDQKGYSQKDLGNLYNSGESIERFFNASYISETNGQKNNYFMQSAPIFYLTVKEGNIDYTAYCIIKSFDFSINSNNFKTEKNLTTIQSFNLSFQIEEIFVNILQVSSIIRTK